MEEQQKAVFFSIVEKDNKQKTVKRKVIQGKQLFKIREEAIFEALQEAFRTHTELYVMRTELYKNGDFETDIEASFTFSEDGKGWIVSGLGRTKKDIFNNIENYIEGRKQTTEEETKSIER